MERDHHLRRTADTLRNARLEAGLSLRQRGEELREVLELADAFPVRKPRRLEYPRFGYRQ